MRWRRYALVGSVLCALDAFTTWGGLRAGGGEANPIIRSIIETAGVAQALTLRAVVGAACFVGVGAAAATIQRLRGWRAPARFAYAAEALLAAVVGWNIGILAVRLAM